MTLSATYTQSDALALAEMVRQGEVSSLELVEEAISRIEQHNPTLNAVVHTDFERARSLAASPPEGPFSGVPFLLKDLMGEDTGQPSTASCSLRKDWTATRDSELVARFKRAGLIILGRTNTPEFGLLGITEPRFRGPTRNPWNTDHIPGGSSGGSGAAVSSRMVPLAHGGDGGGSIRIPASCCGLVGLKPSRGRNPMGPFRRESWGGLVAEHVLTRSVRDCAASLDATHGPDLGEPYQVRPPERPFLEEMGRPPGVLRIGFSTASLLGTSLHPDCVTAVQDAAKLCEELGHEVEEAIPPYDKTALAKAYLSVAATNVAHRVRGAAALAGKSPSMSDVEPSSWAMYLIGTRISAADYVQCFDVIHKMTYDLAQFFGRYDVLLTSTNGQPPAQIGALGVRQRDEWLIRALTMLPSRTVISRVVDQLAVDFLDAAPNTQLFNMSGVPAISLPLHWNDAGLPIGTQFVTRLGDEGLLFRLASQIETARPWAGRLPPLLT